jgi:hypothetical protein
MNNETAFPAIDVQCRDRKRNFCLNLGAFRALEEYLKRETNNPKFDLFRDFDFTANTLSNNILLMWAGFFTDARKHDDKPWTVEECEDVVSALSLKEIEGCIAASLERALSPAQLEKIKKEQEKKTVKKRGRKPKMAA